jgi:uncharacterized membrane protein YkvI
MDQHKTKILYAVGIGLILSDIIPTPADAVYFRLEQKNKAKLQSGEITPKQYWTRDAVAYYALNPLWWSAVLGISLLAGKTFEQKRNILISLVAGGVVIGVLNANIKKDIELQRISRKAE